MFRIAVLIVALLCPSCPLMALGRSTNGPKPQNEDEIQRFLTSFIESFDNLDWVRFRSSFDADATIFYPEFFPRRMEGRSEIDQSWRRVFQNIKEQSGRARPPYMDLKPAGIRVQMLDDVAIVTFHLEHGGTAVGRRTLVLRKTAGDWRIVHLHASNVDFEKNEP